jgi:hypothetical protein
VKLALALIAVAAGAAQLKIQVTDESGKPVWTRLEVHGPDGRMHQPQAAPAAFAALAEAAASMTGLNREHHVQRRDAIRSGRETDPKVTAYPGSFVVNGECRFDLPPGQYRIVAEHGLEYPRIERSVTLSESGASVPIAMKAWIRMNDRGWYSADFHVHRPLDDVPALAQAEGVNLNVVFTMWNRRNLWADRRLPDQVVRTVSPRHLLTVMNAEDERAGGAWMFHQIPEPLGLEKVVPEGQPTTASWSPPGLEFIRRVREWRKSGTLLPWFDSEKTIWW